MHLNRIAVISEGDTINAQARIYAEYRVFATLAAHARSFDRAKIELRQAVQRRPGNQFVCVVIVNLEPSGRFRT